MNNLSLTETELQRLLKVYVSLILTVAVSLYFVHVVFFKYETIAAGWRAISYSLTSITFLFGIFFKLAWRFPWIARWMRRPIVHGVWRGTLTSDFHQADKTPLQIPIIFVIRQTYLTISIESFTKSQEGESKLEALIQNGRTEATRLCYVFELKRLYQGENKLTTGAGDLRLINDSKQLKGHYWTNSPTFGELQLELISRECDGVDCYEVAERKWPSTIAGMAP